LRIDVAGGWCHVMSRDKIMTVLREKGLEAKAGGGEIFMKMRSLLRAHCQCNKSDLAVVILSGLAVALACNESAANSYSKPIDYRPILKQLESTNTSTRLVSARQLGIPSREDFVTPLIAALKDPDWRVRKEAAHSLGRAGFKRALVPLIALTKDDHSEVVIAAIETLGKFDDYRTKNTLVPCVSSDSPLLRKAAIEALAGYREDEWPPRISLLDDDLIPLFIKALKDRDPQVRAAAVRVLIGSGDRRTRQPIIALATDESTDVRAAVATALGQTGNGDAVLPLLQLTRDKNTDVRIAATAALHDIAESQDSPAAGASAIKALEDRNVVVRRQAESALKRTAETAIRKAFPLFSKTSASELAATSLQGTVATVYRDLLFWRRKPEIDSVLARMAEPDFSGTINDVSQLLVPLLSSDSVRVRGVVARSLGTLGGEQVVGPLIKALEDPSPRVKSRVAMALGKTASKRAATALLSVLESDNHLAAMMALAELGDRRVVPYLIEAATKEYADYGTGVETREEVIPALCKSGDPRAVAPLIKLFRNGHLDQIASLRALGHYASKELLKEYDNGNIHALKLLDEDVFWRQGNQLPERVLVDWLSSEHSKARFLGVVALPRTGPSAPLRGLLRDPCARIRSQAAQSAGCMGDTHVDRLLQLLEDHNGIVRAAAARLLGAIGSHRAINALHDALTDPYPPVQQGAVYALQRIADQRSVQPLIAALDDESKGVRVVAATALGELGHTSAVKPLIRLLDDRHSYVRTRAADALGLLGDRRALDPLLACIGDRHDQATRSVVRAIERLADETTVDVLRKHLTHDAWEARRSAAELLGKLKATRATVDLIERLVDEKPIVASSAARALGKIGDQRAVLPLLALLTNAPLSLSAAAAEALGDLHAREAYDPLMKELHVNEVAAKAIIIAIGKLGDERAVPLLCRLLNEGSARQHRSAAAVALGNFRGEDVYRTLMRNADSPSSDISGPIKASLVKIGDVRAIPFLVSRLLDHPYSVIASELASFGVGALDLLLPHHEDVVRSKDVHQKYYYIDCLLEINEDRCVEPLLSFISDEHPSVRRRSIAAIGEFGAAAETALPRLRKASESRYPHVNQAAAVAIRKIEASKVKRKTTE
jgi:HEAT repeat protein